MIKISNSNGECEIVSTTINEHHSAHQIYVMAPTVYKKEQAHVNKQEPVDRTM